MGKLFVTLVLANTADIWTTHLGLSSGCVELNPLYGLVGYYFPAMVAIKTISVGLIGVIALAAPCRLRAIMLWTGILAGFGAAAWNLLVIPSC